MPRMACKYTCRSRASLNNSLSNAAHIAVRMFDNKLWLLASLLTISQHYLVSAQDSDDPKYLCDKSAFYNSTDSNVPYACMTALTAIPEKD